MNMRNENGFTLVEVLLALFLIAIGVLGGASIGVEGAFGGGLLGTVVVVGSIALAAIGPIFTLGGFELRRGDRGLQLRH